MLLRNTQQICCGTRQDSTHPCRAHTVLSGTEGGKEGRGEGGKERGEEWDGRRGGVYSGKIEISFCDECIWNYRLR